jgi:DNA-binding NtrC family response regulator
MSEEKILISDSDDAFAKSLACFLSENGLKPTVIENTETALSALAKDHYDVAVLEFRNHLLRDHVRSAIMHRTNGTAIILTCARHSTDTEREARALSPAFYFVKPIETNDLLAVILRIIEIKNRQEMLALQRMERREGVSRG